MATTVVGSSLDFLYVEPDEKDNQPQYWKNFASFVVSQRIPHVAIGILDIVNHKNIYGVSPSSFLVDGFFKNISGSATRVSVHPYDGFGDPRWPMTYSTFKGLEALVHYMVDMNKQLRDLGLTVTFTGIVVGESMGGKPFQNDTATVTLFRKTAARVGLTDILIGASPGGPHLGLDENYQQVYDWTFYDPSTNPNFWLTYASNASAFFEAIENPHVKGGWNNDPILPQPPWTEMKNYYSNKTWKWEKKDAVYFGIHWMWALHVPADPKVGGEQPRLIKWSPWDGIKHFYEYVKKQIVSSKVTFGKTALYMPAGLELFRY